MKPDPCIRDAVYSTCRIFHPLSVINRRHPLGMTFFIWNAPKIPGKRVREKEDDKSLENPPGRVAGSNAVNRRYDIGEMLPPCC